VSYLRPVDGCPVYTEYFKQDDEVPDRLCPVHKGSVKQRIQRTMESFFSGIKRRVLGVFK
jgi:hypothetical protein